MSAEHSIAGVSWATHQQQLKALQIGGITVQTALRQTGIGSTILKHILQCVRRSVSKAVFLHAQTQAEDSYGKHGLTSNGKTFIKAGKPHIGMQRNLAE